MMRYKPKLFSTLRLLSAVAFMALCFSFADMALAQTARAYSKEAMEQALATKHHYDLYGIHFDFNKAVIQPDSNALLDDIAAALKNFPEWRLRITGHTDSTGDVAYNEVLSMNRANAIKQALVSRRIDAARLETLGMGEKQPVASNETPEGQALNRRVELVRLDVKPNIVFIMGDDIGMWNIGAYHRGLMAGRTPNLDKLAKEGMLFTDYYAEASCTAGRANFITGELPIRTGMTTVGQAGARQDCPPRLAQLPPRSKRRATPPASSARITLAIRMSSCLPSTGSMNSSATSITWTRWKTRRIPTTRKIC